MESMMVKRARGSLLLSIKFDRNSHQPISTQLYVAMRELILAGGFLAGERLPATRTLAKDLGISRTTVIEVFDRLTSESLVTSKTGAGTYVSKALSAERPKHVASQTKIDGPGLSSLQ
jgi:GntR family transcriptional regulator/MocR family aminotransferase